jgi:hypothetical protein
MLRIRLLRLRGRLVSLASGLVLVPTAVAAPFAEPGNPVLREQLVRLADRGCMAAPVTTWPVIWASLDVRDAPECTRAGRAIRDKRRAALDPGLGAELRLGAANQPALIRDRSTPLREKAEVQAGLTGQGEHWAARLSATWADEPVDERPWRADGSYVLGQVGNWALAAGALDRWWGPGRSSDMIWSNNARPVPGLWLNRNRATAPTTDWLSWMGPWSVTLFAGQLENDRAVPRAKFLAGRLVFRPAKTLEIGLSRAVQWGGEGRPDDWTSFRQMLLGHDNVGSAGVDEDPGNQRAGLDFRWGKAFGRGYSLGVYGQLIGEDEAGYLPSKHTWLGGVDWRFPHFGGRGLLYLEATDTTAGAFSGDEHYNTAFEHGTYQTGWRYRGRPLASTWGGDARVATLGLRDIRPDDATVGIMISRASFNRDARMRGLPAGTALEPIRDRSVWIAALDYRRPVLGGTLQARANWTEAVVAPSAARERTTLMLSWERKWSF